MFRDRGVPKQREHLFWGVVGPGFIAFGLLRNGHVLAKGFVADDQFGAQQILRRASSE
jgi:hypothetical protein